MTTSGTRDLLDGDGGVRSAVRNVVRGYRRHLAVMSALAFVGGLCEAVFLVLATRAAFAVTEGADRIGVLLGRFLSVTHALALGAGLLAIRVGLAVAAAGMSARVSSDVVARTRLQLADAFLNASWPMQQKQRGGSLQELLSSFASKSSNMMTAVNQSLVAAANLVALLGLAIAVDPLGALVLVVAVGVFAGVLRPLRSAIRRRAGRNAEAGLAVASAVSDVSKLGMEVNAFHVQGSVLAFLRGSIDESRARTRDVLFARSLVTPVYIGLAYLALLGALALVVVVDATNLTSLGASMLVMLRSLSYGQALQQGYSGMSEAAPVIDELDFRLEELRRGRRRQGSRSVGRVQTIRAEHVVFSYEPGAPVLRDISFETRPRELIGIVGPSGGGKSTLVQLMLGLREPEQGALLVDGVDLREIDRSSWARRVAFVPQEPRVLDGTIEDNVRFFRSDVTIEEIREATKLAHLHEEVEHHADGYQRMIGGEGHLSGGQQQRLCVARALVESPDVLILDEPTSALDVRSEHLLRQTLVDLQAQMTVIVIAHRLSTVELCDRIMVIQDGRLMGFDEPDRLEAASGFYRDALRMSGLR